MDKNIQKILKYFISSQKEKYINSHSMFQRTEKKNPGNRREKKMVKYTD